MALKNLMGDLALESTANTIYETTDLLRMILLENQKTNEYLSLLCDTKITENDIEEE